MLITLMASAEARMITAARAFKKNTEGATAIEYGLIAGGISLAIVAAVFAFGGSLKELFSALADKMAEATATAKTGTD